ncbi:MAG: DUF2059 domain-containing protein [Cellvibrionaceae bacterium]|nr:DUF2059 domain-containing protein [Cellvibrionaceae bacterium]
MKHVIALLLLAWGASIWADEPPAGFNDSTMNAAYELLTAIDMQQQLDQSVAQMSNLMIESNPSMAPYRKVITRFYKKYLGYDSTKAELAELWASHFNERELKELAAFHRTPLGKKLNTKSPLIAAEIGRMSQAIVMENVEELQAMIKREAYKLENLQQDQD